MTGQERVCCLREGSGLNQTDLGSNPGSSLLCLGSALLPSLSLVCNFYFPGLVINDSNIRLLPPLSKGAPEKP